MIQLACPACGAAQEEPSLVVSSFCRRCGAHFRIEDGMAVPPPGPRISGVVVVEEEPWGPEAEQSASRESDAVIPSIELGAQAETLEVEELIDRGVGQTWMEESVTSKDEATEPGGNEGSSSKRSGDQHKRGRRKKGRKRRRNAGNVGGSRSATNLRAESASVSSDSSSENQGAGGGNGVRDTPDEARKGEKTKADSLVLGSDAQPVAALREGSMSVMLEESEDGAIFRPKMPAGFVPVNPRLDDAGDTRRVRCFACHHQQSVSRAASSTQCARCSLYISLENREIHSPWSQSIHTRGNLIIRKQGAVQGCDIACHDLEAQGRVSASVDCSGDAHFCHSGHVMGHLYCHKLTIEKGCELVFPQGVKAQEIEVFGMVVGDLSCSGTITIHPDGAVEGNVCSRAVDLRNGGRLSGEMTIVPDLVIDPPVKSGLFNQLR